MQFDVNISAVKLRYFRNFGGCPKNIDIGTKGTAQILHFAPLGNRVARKDC